jgi:hypothetical protein
MSVIARDAVASDHLVYAWPFPIGPECEVACADDEQVVMCPGWLVGDRLGPGRHRWRTPDPSRPVSAFFVLTAPVEVSFDMTTMFILPVTGQPIRLRAIGALQIRCVDPGLLIAQFVGLPFDRVNDGILRSVSRSVERMLARLLTRRVVMAGAPLAVTDPSMLSGIIEELVAYNPTAGAVFGIELIRMGHLAIAADDGSAPYVALPHPGDGEGGAVGRNGDAVRHAAAMAAAQIARRVGDVSLLDTARSRPSSIPGHGSHASNMTSSASSATASGTLSGAGPSSSGGDPARGAPGALAPAPSARPPATASGEIPSRASSPRDLGAHRRPGPIEPVVPKGPEPKGPEPKSHDAAAHEAKPFAVNEDITQPGLTTPVPGAMRLGAAGAGQLRPDATPTDEIRGSILGIGVSTIGPSSVSGEISPRVAPGARVMVPGPNGLMQSATVRQLLQGYYELEVGSSGETIWVPIGGVVPEH